MFEEFQGAITGSGEEQAWLSRADYLALGVRQSIYPQEQREAIYDLFETYRRFLDEEGRFDPNIVSHAWLPWVEARYDFVVVDEVQDLTTVQLLLILRALRDPRRFLLCGDSNQIVHPNFFSWAKVKTLFWKRQQADTAPAELVRILGANFRNSPQVTELANRLLRIKQARFGSVDRESNYLVRSCGPAQGRAVLLADRDEIKLELDRRTAASTRFAVLVLHAEQKAEVRKHFRTPLVFSIQEAKGLEYENVLLYGFVAGEEKRFRDIAAGLAPEDLQGGLRYARARDKGDKSLEVYKFYINALYVAVTRAVKNLYLIEDRPGHPLLALLGLTESGQVDQLEESHSSLEEWRREAQRLELQGKEEQAEEIRSQILKQKQVPWKVLRGEVLAELRDRALERGEKKARVTLLEYALVYQAQSLLNALIAAGFQAARHPDKGLPTLERKHYLPYTLKHFTGVMREVDRYGVDYRNLFGQTPLMVASRMGNAELSGELLDAGADTALVDGNGLNAFQIALERACADPRYARSRLPSVWDRLAPASIDIQVDERLVRLDRHHMEYLMLSVAMVLFYRNLGENWAMRGHCLSSADFVGVLEHFPETLAPSRRKRRAYISSILSKNELFRQDPYNRKLFRRMRHGQYLINPRLALRVEGEWRNVYELLEPQRLAARHRDPQQWYGKVYDLNPALEAGIAALREMLERMTRGESPVETAGNPDVDEPREGDEVPEGDAVAAVETPPERGQRAVSSETDRERAPEQLGFDFF